MSTAELILVPYREPSANNAKVGRFVAVLDGRQLIKPTRQPFFNAARQLLTEGVSPETVLTARHDGSTTIAMRSTVGEAAKWMIKETDRRGLQKVPYAPPPSRLRAQHSARTAADQGDGILLEAAE